MKEIIIDFSTYNDVADFHKDIKERLNLSDYYGENLDALHDEMEALPEDAFKFIFFYGGAIPYKQQVQIAKILLRQV